MSERFIPVTYNEGNFNMSQFIATINKNFGELDSESSSKVYRGSNGQIAIIEGRLPYSGGFGSLYYDQNGKAKIVIGITPEGRCDLVIAKDDKDLLTDVFT